MRFGLKKRLEFRMFWLGQTWIQPQSRHGGPFQPSGGLSDMEVGFKWQLLEGDKERKWIPTTALITSIYAPTGGTSILGSHTVEPYVNLIYGWSLTDKLTLAGSTGYLGMRQTDLGRGRAADSFERYHQSLVAFFSATERTTLFYEWYALMFTNAADNRPTHFMDGGLLYRLTPNMQFDLRAGFGLSGRPDDFFTARASRFASDAALRQLSFKERRFESGMDRVPGHRNAILRLTTIWPRTHSCLLTTHTPKRV